MVIDKKIVVSGSSFEVYDYEKGLFVDNTSLGFNTSYSPAVNLRRIISCNLYRWRADNSKAYLPIFLTLTYRQQDINVLSARHLYKLFIAKFAKYKKKLDGLPLKYVSVMEFTKKGVPHFHILFFNLPFIPDLFGVLSKLWGNGYVLFKKVDRNGDKVALYMAKYIGKGIKAPDGLDERNGFAKCRRRKFNASRGLYRPVTLLHPDAQFDFMAGVISTAELYTQFSYSSYSTGKVIYRQYLINNPAFDLHTLIHYTVDDELPLLDNYEQYIDKEKAH